MDDHEITRFTSLWTQAQTSVYAFISGSISSFSDADDLLQKVAGVAVTKFSDFKDENDAAAFARWCMKISRFEILRFMRDQATDRHQFVTETVEAVTEAFEELSPEFDDRRHALAKCLEGLQGRSREVLEKRYGDGLKTGAIAELMGPKGGNVSMILNRSYKQLRACIETRIAEGTA